MSAFTKPRFGLLFAALLIIGAGNSMLLAVAPPLVRQLNLPDSSVGWIFSLSALIWVFSSPYWGRLSDSLGRKPVAALGLAAFAVSMGAFGLAMMLGLMGLIHGALLFTALVLARAIFGLFGSATFPAAQAYVADHTTPLERTEQLASLTAAFAFGQAFGPAICAALASKLGLVFPILLVAVLAAVAAYAVWRFLPERAPATQESLPLADRSRAGDFAQSLKLSGDPRLSAYLVYGFALSVVAGILVQVFGLFTMDRLGVSGEQGAEFTAAGFMVGALAVLATQMAILPRLGFTSRQLMLWGSALMGVGVLIQIAAPGLAALLVSQAVQGVGGGLARPGFAGGASVAVRPQEQGAAAGLVGAVSGAGFIVSPLLGGVAYELIGITAPFWIAALLLAAMFAFVWRSKRLKYAIVAEAPSDAGSP